MGQAVPPERHELRLYLPAELHSWAADIAHALGQDFSDLVVRAVEREVDRQIVRGGPELIARVEEARQNGDPVQVEATERNGKRNGNGHVRIRCKGKRAAMPGEP
jgi:hypothetical protein